MTRTRTGWSQVPDAMIDLARTHVARADEALRSSSTRFGARDASIELEAAIQCLADAARDVVDRKARTGVAAPADEVHNMLRRIRELGDEIGRRRDARYEDARRRSNGP